MDWNKPVHRQGKSKAHRRGRERSAEARRENLIWILELQDRHLLAVRGEWTGTNQFTAKESQKLTAEDAREAQRPAERI
jgi:hypothetical protein